MIRNNNSPFPTNALPDSVRIETLRRNCLDRKQLRQPMKMPLPSEILTAWEATSDEHRLPRKRGLMTRHLLERMRFEIADGELLLGRLSERPAKWSDDEQRIWQYLSDDLNILPPGMTGHCQLDYSMAFRLGLDGLKTEIMRCLENPVNNEKNNDVLTSFIDAVEGLSAMIVNAANLAEKEAETAEKKRAAELRAMAECACNVACKPPAHFHEGIQLMWFMILSVSFANLVSSVVPGRIDRILYTLFKKDMDAGRLNTANALLMLESLYLMINEFVPDGGAISVMVGGTDENGADTTNELSLLCLEALRRTKLVYPTVGVCWHPGTPEPLTNLAVELMSLGYSTPAFFGDSTIRKGLHTLGVPHNESCNYINSTCVEITPCGASNVYVAAPYFNLCGLLLEEIAAQTMTENSGAANFADFLAALKERLSKVIAAAAAEQCEIRRKRCERGGKPLQSVFTRDCIDRAQDIDDGGARYNWVECSFVGIANLADSLYVIEHEVFRQRQISLVELKNILDTDFTRNEAIRLRFGKYPKYGNADSNVDTIVAEIISFLTDECAKHKIRPDQSPFVPGAFCFVMHEKFGRACGATPDGRRKGSPFADGCGPAQGCEKNGPTSAILSTTSWAHSPFIGGLAYNMKFSQKLFSNADAQNKLRDLIVTYLQRGGFEVQVNIIDGEKLRNARENPDSFRDLVVRIGGYTDYFTRLNPEMQDEVIRRTEFNAL